MKQLLSQIKNCTVCHQHLPFEPRPIVAASTASKIIIIGQAPGKIVHDTGIPWNDKSGENLRRWLQVDKEAFYNTHLFALMPMGFCYPGKNKTGDAPPREECAPLWHERLIKQMKEVQLILLVGQYAQQYYLGPLVKSTLTETVKSYKLYRPLYFPLPHPSPRNNIWMAKNKWFERELLPQLQKHVHRLLQQP
jgi:uracil-DNA glycosylase family 4